MPNKSLKHNATWAIAGNVGFAIGRLLIIMFLAKAFADDVDSMGQFMFAIAVATPIAIFFQMESRSVYVTDTKDKIDIGHYLSLRIVTNVLFLIALAILCLAFRNRWGNYKTLTVMLVGIVRAIESISDIFLSILQKKEKMKYWAISQIFKVTSVIAWVAIMWAMEWGYIWLMPIGWFVACVIILWLWDYRQATKFANIKLKWDRPLVKKIISKAFPLGLFVTFSSFNSQVGQYFIELKLTDLHVAYFGAMVHFMAGPMAIQNGFNQAMLPRLAKYYTDNISAFIKLLIRMIVISSIAMTGMLIIFHFWAAQILTIIYTKDYATQADLLFTVGIASCAILFSMILGDAIIAAQRFKARLFAIIAGLIINIAMCNLINPTRGITPAAHAMLASAIIVTIICAVVLVLAIKQKAPTK